MIKVNKTWLRREERLCDLCKAGCVGFGRLLTLYLPGATCFASHLPLAFIFRAFAFQSRDDLSVLGSESKCLDDMVVKL